MVWRSQYKNRMDVNATLFKNDSEINALKIAIHICLVSVTLRYHCVNIWFCNTKTLVKDYYSSHSIFFSQEWFR